MTVAAREAIVAELVAGLRADRSGGSAPRIK
jgi:hypothetical protein